MTPERFAAGLDIDTYIEGTRKNTEFWRGVRRLARIEEGHAAIARSVTAPLNVLVLSEDWCGDAVNIVPVVARLIEAMPATGLRILGRDDNPDLMNAHLTHGTRSIPVLIVYDAAFRERGWWGPRPRELQRLFLDEWQGLEKADRGRHVRAWYARDRGRSTVAEVLDLLRGAAGASQGADSLG